MIKIATWNINSVRIRLENIRKLLEEEDIDVLCLQETKVINDLFPINFFKELGYPHISFRGEKSYNGVAIISRLLFEEETHEIFAEKIATRHISVKLEKDIYLHNFYVPAGGDIPDPELNPSFDYKLKFLDHMTEWSKANFTSKDNLILVGDLNIAPLDNDVWSHKQLLKEVSHTPIEVEKLTKFQATIDWQDAARKFVPSDQKLYSWWSYRNRDWQKSNRGRRLDHIWTSPALIDKVKDCYILKEARNWLQPSDHVPVILVLNKGD